MLNIVLFGPPGAGKGTQSKKIIEQYGLVHLSTGDLFRKHLKEGTDLGKKAREFMDHGKLVPDQIVIDMVDVKISEHMDAAGFIFDGFPRTVAQAEALDRLLEKKSMKITRMVALEVPDEIIKERLKGRAALEGRTDDQDEDKIKTRINVYKEETMPVAGYYDDQQKLSKINGVGQIDEIYASIHEVIKAHS
jgi:adenylate kinase